MKQVEKYLLKISLLLGIFIMPFAASAEEVDMGETTAYHFSLDGNHTFPSLTNEDKQILDMVIQKLGYMSKNEIIDFMHKEQSYTQTAPRDVISFKYAQSLQI